jgi:hypothetical protein
MKPDSRNRSRPLVERPFRVLIITGSNRRQYNCPGVDSKSGTLMMRMADRLPQHWEIDIEDPGNVYRRARIQSGGTPREELIDHKNPEMGMRLEHSPEWDALSVRPSQAKCHPDSSAPSAEARRRSGRPTCG